jgi:hypothetical protein
VSFSVNVTVGSVVTGSETWGQLASAAWNQEEPNLIPVSKWLQAKLPSLKLTDSSSFGRWDSLMRCHYIKSHTSYVLRFAIPAPNPPPPEGCAIPKRPLTLEARQRVAETLRRLLQQCPYHGFEMFVLTTERTNWITNYLLTLINSTEQRSDWEADSCSDRQEISRFLWCQNVRTVFAWARKWTKFWVSWLFLCFLVSVLSFLLPPGVVSGICRSGYRSKLFMHFSVVLQALPSLLFWFYS